MQKHPTLSLYLLLFSHLHEIPPLLSWPELNFPYIQVICKVKGLHPFIYTFPGTLCVYQKGKTSPFITQTFTFHLHTCFLLINPNINFIQKKILLVFQLLFLSPGNIQSNKTISWVLNTTIIRSINTNQIELKDWNLS